jgi:hypothetical protein
MTGGPLVTRLSRNLSGAFLRLPFLPHAAMFSPGESREDGAAIATGVG